MRSTKSAASARPARPREVPVRSRRYQTQERGEHGHLQTRTRSGDLVQTTTSGNQSRRGKTSSWRRFGCRFCTAACKVVSKRSLNPGHNRRGGFSQRECEDIFGTCDGHFVCAVAACNVTDVAFWPQVARQGHSVARQRLPDCPRLEPGTLGTAHPQRNRLLQTSLGSMLTTCAFGVLT